MTQEEPQSTEDPSLKGEITNMSDADKRILMLNLTNNRLFLTCLQLIRLCKEIIK